MRRPANSLRPQLRHAALAALAVTVILLATGSAAEEDLRASAGRSLQAARRFKCTAPGKYAIKPCARSFYLCTKVGKRLQMKVVACPKGLAFNPQRKACSVMKRIPGCSQGVPSGEGSGAIGSGQGCPTFGPMASCTVPCYPCDQFQIEPNCMDGVVCGTSAGYGEVVSVAYDDLKGKLLEPGKMMVLFWDPDSSESVCPDMLRWMDEYAQKYALRSKVVKVDAQHYVGNGGTQFLLRALPAIRFFLNGVWVDIFGDQIPGYLESDRLWDGLWDVSMTGGDCNEYVKYRMDEMVDGFMGPADSDFQIIIG